MKTILAILAFALVAGLPAADLTLAEIRAQLESAHPTLTERVNGETVTLSAEQRAAVIDRWAADRFQAQAQAAQAAKQAQAKAALEAGYTVQPDGFTLAMGDSDRAQFTQLLTLIQEALSMGLITNDTPQTIADKAREKHTITTLRLRQILVMYGLHYKTIWDAATTP